jgi:hypothetical protein
MSDFARLTAEDDLVWYATSLGRGVEPEDLEQRLVLTNRLHDSAEELYAAADDLATFVCLHLEGSSATAGRAGRPNMLGAWEGFLSALRDGAQAVGLDGCTLLAPMAGEER